MKEPRLFVDGPLLSAVVVELEDELGYPRAARTLFLIGLTHGLRDADRAVGLDFSSHGSDGAEPAPMVHTALPMDLAPPTSGPDGHELHGHWPAHYEADAWLRKFGPADTPSCWLSAGYTSGWLSGTLDADILALEDRCAGCDGEDCHFVAREPTAWEQHGPHEQRELLGPIDFDLFRMLALHSPSAAQKRIETDGEFDPDAPVVHIWGPVMILPYTGADEILRTTQELSQDPSIRDITAVVVDLRDELLDESFGAAAIEQVLATIESWGAEPILTGVTLLSEAVVDDLESGHLLVHKSLDEAIAAAFLVSEAQRHAA